MTPIPFHAHSPLGGRSAASGEDLWGPRWNLLASAIPIRGRALRPGETKLTGPTGAGVRYRAAKIARGAVALGILGAICALVDLPTALGGFAELRWPFVGALCAAAVLGRVLMAYKWNLLLRARDISISLWEATRLYFVALLLGSVTPGDLGGDAYRVVALSRFERSSVVASTVVLERLIGLVVVFACAMIALPFSVAFLGPAADSVVWGVVCGTLAVSAGLFASMHAPVISWAQRRLARFSSGSLGEKLQRFYAAYAENRDHRAVLLGFFALTALEVVLSVLVSYFAARSLGVAVPFTSLLALLPLAFLLLRIPISFQGLGIQEGVFVFVLVAVGATAEEGLALSILLRVAGVFVGLAPAALMMWMFPVVIAPAPDPSDAGRFGSLGPTAHHDALR